MPEVVVIQPYNTPDFSLNTSEVTNIFLYAESFMYDVRNIFMERGGKGLGLG